ncbi:MAG: efflux RND transporter periplasmic adaptor subunit [Thiogranum sp.]
MKDQAIKLFRTFPVAILAFTTAVAVAQQNSFDCVIEPSMVVELSSRVDGIVETVLVERGDLIEPDTVIAKLESGAEAVAVEHARARSKMEAEIRSLKASLAYGWRNHKRLDELHKKQSISTDEIDRAKTETRVAKHKLQQAEENKRLAELELARAEQTLKRHTIRSPIGGVVAERYLNPGESVEDRPVVKVVQIDPLRVEVVMPVSEFGRIKTGQHAVVRPEASIGGRHESTVTIVDPIIDAASGTFRVTLMLPNPEHKLTSGLRCQVSFLTKPPANAKRKKSLPSHARADAE